MDTLQISAYSYLKNYDFTTLVKSEEFTVHCNSNIDKKLANSSLRFFSFKKFVDYKKKSLYLQPNYNLTSNIKACDVEHI